MEDKGVSKVSGNETAERAPKTMKAARTQYKRRLHGMINVRTDGETIFCARRIAGNPPWEYYSLIPAK